MAGLLASPDELKEIHDMSDLRVFAGLTGEAWTALESRLGTGGVVMEFANIPKDEVDQAALVVLVLAPTPANPHATRKLSAVELAQVELMWMVAQQKAEALENSEQMNVPAALEPVQITNNMPIEAIGMQRWVEQENRKEQTRQAGLEELGAAVVDAHDTKRLRQAIYNAEQAGVDATAVEAAQAVLMETSRQNERRKHVEALAAACRTGDAIALQKAISWARAAGFASQTKQAAQMLGNIVTRRDEERWREDAAYKLKAAQKGNIDVAKLRDAIIRAWHAEVEESATEEATIVLRRAEEKQKQALMAFHEARKSRDVDELRHVVELTKSVGLTAESVVAADMLAEEEALERMQVEAGPMHLLEEGQHDPS